MIIKTSWDDGVEQDLQMAELLQQYNLTGTFFIPTKGNQLGKWEIQDLAKHFKIGGHTTTHPEDIKRITDQKKLFENISYNRVWLQQVSGQDVLEFCYPGGRYNQQTIDAVKASGYTSARTTMIGCTDIPQDMFRIYTTVHVKRIRKEYNGESWLDYAKRHFLEAKAKPEGYFHVWGHSWEVEQEGLWKELEELFSFIQENATDNSNRSNDYSH